MNRSRRCRRIQILGTLAVAAFLFGGCNGGAGNGGGSTGDATRISLQLVMPGQATSRRLRSAGFTGRRRQVEPGDDDFITTLKVTISGEGVATMTASFPVSEAEQAEKTVEIQVPRGRDLLLDVVGSNGSGTEIFRGQDTVVPIQTEQTLTIVLKLVATLANTVRIGSPLAPVAPGATFTVPVEYNAGATRVVSYLFALTFDPGIVNVVSIDAVFPYVDLITDTAAFSSGKVAFLGHNTTSPPINGLIPFADITFRVVASPTANSSDLSLAFNATPGGTGILVSNLLQAIPGVNFARGTVDVKR